MAKKKRYKQNQSWFQIKAKGSQKAEIYIYGDIGENWWEPEKSNTAENLIDELGELKGKDITVRINSFGGSVVDGIAIYNALKRHDGVVDVAIDAVAYSAASLIAMAGEKVVMAENALLMIHAPLMSWVTGNAERMRSVADILDKYADAMVSSYLRDGGPDESTVSGWLKDGEDHYFTAAEALEEGLIDSVTDAVDVAASLHSFNMRGYATPLLHPAAVVAAHKPSPEGPTMAKKTEPAATPKPAAPATPVNAADPQNQPDLADGNVVAIENAAYARRDAQVKARNDEILPIFALHVGKPGMSELKDQVLGDPAITTDKARAMILDQLGQGTEPLNQVHPHIAAGVDARDKNIEAKTQALLSRVSHEDQDRQNPYRGLTLHEMARMSLEESGTPVRGMSPVEFAPIALNPVLAMQTGSDFQVVLENTLHKMVLAGFHAQKSTYQRIAKMGNVSDFREWNRLVPGLVGNLDGVDEHGAYKDKTLPDAVKNAIKVSRTGNIIGVTPEVIINDDLGYLEDMSTYLGGAGPITIDRAVYALIESNPNLSDGHPLFSTEHGNLAGSGAAPSVSTLDAAGVAMAGQVAPGDDAVELDIEPDIALCHRGLRGQMYEVVNAEFNDDTSKNQRKPNRVRGIVSDIVSTGRLASNAAWYLFANPSIAPVIEVAFLNGQREPRVSMEESFRTSGMSWKVELPFGVAAIGHHGGFKNPGQ
ncbi:MAG: ClpP-like prohead protease/major capsid protein fusion protein [Candidatus Thiodiazotropha taylori]